MSEIAIEVQNVSKIYPIFSNKSDRLKEALSFARKKYHVDFYALKDISFTANKGEAIGIIGQNGSGKSTLLKILSGVLTQTSGNIQVNGKISALLELGAGFNPEMTGLENIYLNGTIMGYSKDEMDSKLDRIIEFADIGQFINQPVKMYSSGMFVRLAFAVAINVEPEILVVDEALAVGDIRFQQKCYRKIDNFRKHGTVIMVSHDLSAISRFCSKVIWIHGGMIKFSGDVNNGIKRYQNFIINQGRIKRDSDTEKKECGIVTDKKLKLRELPKGIDKAGDGKAEILACGLFDSSLEEVEFVQPLKEYTFAVRISFNEVIQDVIIGILVKNRMGTEIFGVNTDLLEINADTHSKVCEYRYSFVMPNLNGGDYFITVAVSSGVQKSHIHHCWIHDAIIFKVLPKNKDYAGIIECDIVEFTKLEE
ncbi:MAG: ABC transporter ATP-binding protein [Desulfitobacterium sp.]